MIKRTECPTCAIDCPYFNRGYCYMYQMEGVGPAGECDEYDAYNPEDEEEE